MAIPDPLRPRTKHESSDLLTVAAYLVLAISFAAIVWVASGLLGSS